MPAARTVLPLALCAVVLLSAASSDPASRAAPAASPAPPAPPGAIAASPLTAAQRGEVLDALARQLAANYVFPDVAASVATQLRAKDAAGGYASATDTLAFAHALSDDLRTLGKDGHFRVVLGDGGGPRRRIVIGPGPGPGGAAGPKTTDAGGDNGPRRVVIVDGGPEGGDPEGGEPRRMPPGVAGVERLAGNIGYVELLGFPPGAAAREAMSAAMLQLRDADAIIVDLRRNGGGEPGAVAWWMSHFFAADDVRHINDIYNRPNDVTDSFHTDPAAPVHFTGPVQVLVSKKTFSGGEEAAYDFQTQKRGIVVGEVTGGGANPGEQFPLAHGLSAFIPTGRAINPVTKTNWEHVGVQPDVAVPAADALKVAHVALLREAIAASKDPARQRALGKALADVEADRATPN